MPFVPARQLQDGSAGTPWHESKGLDTSLHRPHHKGNIQPIRCTDTARETRVPGPPSYAALIPPQTCGFVEESLSPPHVDSSKNANGKHDNGWWMNPSTPAGNHSAHETAEVHPGHPSAEGVQTCTWTVLFSAPGFLQ